MHKSYKGKVLISTPDSNIDIFSKSVVLIIDHNSEGAFGLILNKKGKYVESNFNEILGKPMPIYLGGPVQKDQIFFIVKGHPLNEFHLKINSNFFITENTQSIIEQIVNGELKTDNIKVFIGYSGWSANQLENEIKNGSWTVMDDFHFDFTDTKSDFWKKSKEHLGGKHLIWANTPEDISLN